MSLKYIRKVSKYLWSAEIYTSNIIPAIWFVYLFLTWGSFAKTIFVSYSVSTAIFSPVFQTQRSVNSRIKEVFAAGGSSVAISLGDLQQLLLMAVNSLRAGWNGQERVEHS